MSEFRYLFQFCNDDIIENDKLRVFSKIEMCRLQGFTDNYCDILSEEESGSLLGDGWTLPMIEHILSFYVDIYNN